MNASPTFFDGWSKIWRTIVLAVIAYSLMVIVLRMSRKRTLAKMNVFDFVFIVALGSILASSILIQDITLSEGFAAFITLIAAQWVVSWLTASSARAERIINGEPALLVHRGKCLREVMRRERVTEEEIRAALRARGLSALELAEAVVLETDGSFSIIPAGERSSFSSLADVPEHDAH